MKTDLKKSCPIFLKKTAQTDIHYGLLELHDWICCTRRPKVKTTIIIYKKDRAFSDQINRTESNKKIYLEFKYNT